MLGRHSPPQVVSRGVFVILEMDGSTDELLAAAADLEARRTSSANDAE
jgi:hypothetical protein